MEATLAQHEDKPRRDNIWLINQPEKSEKSDPIGFISSSLPKWFPNVTDVKLEVMRAHGIGPERNGGQPRTLIFKMLLFTDRDKLLKHDYMRITAISPPNDDRNTICQVMEAGRKQGFSTFLPHMFQTHTQATGLI